MKEAILSTLVYYHLWGDAPLTAIEIYQHLFWLDNFPKKAGFDDFLSYLDKLVAEGKIFARGGYFFLVEDDFFSRQKNYKISLLKKKRLLWYLKFFVWWPTIKGLALSGSLDADNARGESDWDVLVICRQGYVWLTRSWLALISHLLGRRRYQRKIKDRFCWNYFLANQKIHSKYQTFGQAQMFSRLVPLFGQDEFIFLWKKNNQWIKKFLPNFPEDYQKNVWLIDNFFWVKIERSLGKILSLILVQGKNWLRRWQKEKINRSNTGLAIKYNYLSLSDDLLIFHYPPSRGVLAEERLEEWMNKNKVKNQNSKVKNEN